MYSIASGVRVARWPLPLLPDARELQSTGGVMLDVCGQRPDLLANVVISIASSEALDKQYMIQWMQMKHHRTKCNAQ